MKFIDLFAGIGGFRLGMERAGHECVGWCEIDKFAQKSYKAMYDTKGEWFADDIRTIEPRDMPEFDCITGGFPCQAFSVAGKRGGFEDTRGTLFFEIARIIRERQPKLVFLENVKGLLNHDGGRTFGTILNTFWEVGYDVEWQLLNSKDFGVPQNRERVFIIGYLRSRGRREILPITRENSATLKKIIGGCQGERVYDPKGISCTLTGCGGGGGGKTGLYYVGNVNPSGRGMNGNVYSSKGLAPTVTTNKGEGSKILIDQSHKKPKLTNIARCITSRYTAGIVNRSASNSAVLEARAVLTPERINKRQNGRRMKETGEPMFTLTSGDRHGVAIKEATKKGFAEAHVGDSINLSFPNSKTRRGRVGKEIAQTLDTSCEQGTLTENLRIRRLTPRECFRLQGFPDSLFDKARKVNSDAQLYKQAGNAVTVNVAYEIAETIKNSAYK